MAAARVVLFLQEVARLVTKSTLQQVMESIKQPKEYSTLVSNCNADHSEHDQLPVHGSQCKVP